MYDREDLETPPCPLCDACEIDAAGHRRPPFRVVRCGRCRVWYLSPRLTESAIAGIYASEDYYEGAGGSGYSSYSRQERSLSITFERLLRELEGRGLAEGSLLDVGCGFGQLLRAGEGRFSRRAGTDFSAAAATKARRHADEVYVGGVDAVPPSERFDLVTAIHVLEHVYAPREFVRALWARVRPGGALVLAVPDMGSYWRKGMGRLWPSYKFPEHVVFYDAASLRRLVGQLSDVREVSSIPYPHAFPLELIAAKLGLPFPSRLGGTSVWLRRTTVAIVAFKDSPG